MMKFIKFSCKNEECKLRITEEEYIQHTEACKYNKKKCINHGCEEMMTIDVMKAHLQDYKCKFQKL